MLGSASRSIVANIFTPSYRILGRVTVGNSGLIGLLNDPSHSSITVTDASLARLHEPKKIADKTDEMIVVKRGLVLLGLARDADVGPQSMARGGFGRVARYPVRAVTGTFEMEGKLEWSGRFSLQQIVFEGGDFIALYEAKLRAIHYPDLQMGSPVVIFNRRKLDIVRTIEETEEDAGA